MKFVIEKRSFLVGCTGVWLLPKGSRVISSIGREAKSGECAVEIRFLCPAVLEMEARQFRVFHDKAILSEEDFKSSIGTVVDGDFCWDVFEVPVTCMETT